MDIRTIVAAHPDQRERYSGALLGIDPDMELAWILVEEVDLGPITTQYTFIPMREDRR